MEAAGRGGEFHGWCHEQEGVSALVTGRNDGEEELDGGTRALLCRQGRCEQQQLVEIHENAVTLC